MRGLIHASSDIEHLISIVEANCEQFESGVSVQIERIDRDPIGSPDQTLLRPKDRYRLRIEADPQIHSEWLYVMVLQCSADGLAVPIYPSVFDSKVPFLVPGVELLVPELICDYELRAPQTPGQWRLRVITSLVFDWSRLHLVLLYWALVGSMLEVISASDARSCPITANYQRTHGPLPCHLQRRR